MLVLNKGEYTGDIIRSLAFDGSFITNTHYTTKKNNPDWHYHENLHISFVFQGGKSQTRNTTNYTKKNGSIFFYNSEEIHRWVSPYSTSKSANIELSAYFLKTYNLSIDDIKSSIFNNVDAKALMIKMQQEMCLNESNSTETIKLLLLELVSHSKKYTFKSLPNWVILLTELLHDHWNNYLTLDELSKSIGVHPVTISKYFRKYVNCTLGEYQRKLKIENSILLIKESKMSLTEIALYCGFSDQSHFIRNFKQMTGFLPKHFQKF